MGPSDFLQEKTPEYSWKKESLKKRVFPIIESFRLEKKRRK